MKNPELCQQFRAVNTPGEIAKGADQTLAIVTISPKIQGRISWQTYSAETSG